jgi:hypothetical protein
MTKSVNSVNTNVNTKIYPCLHLKAGQLRVSALCKQCKHEISYILKIIGIEVKIHENAPAKHTRRGYREL